MHQDHLKNTVFQREQPYPGLERLICMAFADPAVAYRLVVDPAQTLAQVAPQVQLTPAEYALAATITNATDIYMFAERLYEKMQQS